MRLQRGFAGLAGVVAGVVLGAGTRVAAQPPRPSSRGHAGASVSWAGGCLQFDRAYFVWIRPDTGRARVYDSAAVLRLGAEALPSLPDALPQDELGVTRAVHPIGLPEGTRDARRWLHWSGWRASSDGALVVTWFNGFFGSEFALAPQAGDTLRGNVSLHSDERGTAARRPESAWAVRVRCPARAEPRANGYGPRNRGS